MATSSPKARQRRTEPLAARICANPECGIEFEPQRVNQVFHETPCRKAYWTKAVHWTPHACPLCTMVHDPEEAAVLDALEMLVRHNAYLAADPSDPGSEDEDAVLVETLRGFIARRRAILATKPAAPTD